MKRRFYYTDLGAKILGWFFLIIGIAIFVISVVTGFTIFVVMTIIPLFLGISLLALAFKNSRK